jgi:hypothetical protein
VAEQKSALSKICDRESGEISRDFCFDRAKQCFVPCENEQSEKHRNIPFCGGVRVSMLTLGCGSQQRGVVFVQLPLLLGKEGLKFLKAFPDDVHGAIV